MKNDRFRKDADLLLGGMRWTQADASRVLSELKGERPIMKKKMRMGLALACAIMLLAAAALATGLIFSPRYDAVRLADEALEAKYGITPAMMTVLYRTQEAADGGSVMTYRSVEEQWAEQIGAYTVTVRANRAEAAWSHDGEPVSAGFSSPVWGAEQIALILSDYAGACAATLGEVEPIPMPSAAQIEAERQRREEDAKAAQARAKITPDEARALAAEAIAQVYKLTDAQRAALVFLGDIDESFCRYGMENGEPVIDICYGLNQPPTDAHVDGDGQYWVTIHAETGVIEDVLYDSGLAGNG